MTIDTDNEVADQTTANEIELDLANQLHALKQAIAKMPDVDPERIQAVINKLQSSSLQILGTEEERLASAMRIARQIIDETSE